MSTCVYQVTVVEVIPASGYRNSDNLNNRGSNGNYWSSSLNSSNTDNAYNLNFNSGNINPSNNNNRYYGYPVRPVAAFANVQCMLHTIALSRYSKLFMVVLIILNTYLFKRHRHILQKDMSVPLYLNNNLWFSK